MKNRDDSLSVLISVELAYPPYAHVRLTPGPLVYSNSPHTREISQGWALYSGLQVHVNTDSV